MKTDQLRQEYLSFFEDKKHKGFPSDSLVPQDPTVLFTSAGMNQFKPYFLGEKKDITRAVSCQKCLRTDDLDLVGKTPCHHTFFEMLGNFSFGDYFKREAVLFAWEFLTDTLNIKENNLSVSVYSDDQEAFLIWKEEVGIDQKRIVKLGPKQNFWPSNAPELGPNGPCGPCSEIFFDKGVSFGCKNIDCNPDCDCGRFVEIWNLVFTQFNRIDKSKLEPLPQRNIDTGMGLERMASVLQGVDSNFQIDIIYPIVKYTKELIVKQKKSSLNPGAADKDFNGLVRAVVDHVRAAVFSISDGVFPSNEERGYVVRKLIRKAYWHGYSLGVNQPFLFKLVNLISELMGKPYRDIADKKDKISEVIRLEEEKFIVNIDGAQKQFFNVVADLKGKREKKINGQTIFKLYDTYGIPLELTKQLAEENGLDIDEESFNEFLLKQKDVSRQQSMFKDTIFARDEYAFEAESEFVGHSLLEVDTDIIKIIKDKREVYELSKNETGIVLLATTPFYPEGGGQSSDKGMLETSQGAFRVERVEKTKNTIIHFGKVNEGVIAKGLSSARVDKKRRFALMRAHTATHLLQAALRSVLGDHITQQGSMVEADRLRFDFNHFKALTSDELHKAEETVNDFILSNYNIRIEMLSLEEAKKQGALAFFKDKYSDHVRVVSISDCSKELCGGTHIESTSSIGIFMIVGEYSVSSGIRRIEALTGSMSYRKLLSLRNIVKDAAFSLKSKEEDILEAIARIDNLSRSYKERLDNIEKERIHSKIDDVIKEKVAIGDLAVFIYEFKDMPYSQLLYLSDILRSRFDKSFLFFLSSDDKRDIFVSAISEQSQNMGISLSNFFNQCRGSLNLKGGGKGLTGQGVFLQPKQFLLCKEKIIEFLSKELKK
ncbi:MAG: alanine--tRNA ligase [Candidatus Omnitrophota bacterium]